MSNPEEIKNQTTINSENVTPEEAAKDLDELKEKDLGKVAGGEYPDWLLKHPHGVE
ncbi:MAG TPA: hypothetical protein VKO18_21155 [Terriglobia bacterium]|nr:hypothetical protein [Terriglobia bacterium]